MCRCIGMRRRKYRNVTRKVNSMIVMEDDFAELTLSTLQNKKHLTERGTFPKCGNGYRWDLMYQVLSGGVLPSNYTRPEQIVKGIRLIERIKAAAQD